MISELNPERSVATDDAQGAEAGNIKLYLLIFAPKK